LLVVGADGRTPVPDTPRAESAGAPSSGPLPPAARAGVALVFAGVVLEWSVAYWGATYLREVVGLGRPAAVTAMTCFFAAMLLGRIAAGVLVRRRDPVRLVAGSLAVVAAGLAVHAVSTAPTAALVGLVLLGLGVAALFPLGLSLAVAGAVTRPTDVSGRCVIAGSTAVLLGPLVVGQLADVLGLRTALGVLPLVALGAALLVRRIAALR
jgi:fucose permease